jgi:hypothetical protein
VAVSSSSSRFKPGRNRQVSDIAGQIAACFAVSSFSGEGAGYFQIGGPIPIKILWAVFPKTVKRRNGGYFRRSYQRFGCFTLV